MDDDTMSSSEPAVPSEPAIDAERTALWKKQSKQLKAKDIVKKLDAIAFCAQDELFVRQQPEIASQLITFVTRTKVPEVVTESLRVFDALVATPGDATIHGDLNAQFFLQQAIAPESSWKALDPFLSVITSSQIEEQVKLLSLQVYQRMLQCTERINGGDQLLVQLQILCHPFKPIANGLNSPNEEVQAGALGCLTQLLRVPPASNNSASASTAANTPNSCSGFFDEFDKFDILSKALMLFTTLPVPGAEVSLCCHVPFLGFMANLCLSARGRTLVKNKPNTLTILTNELEFLVAQRNVLVTFQAENEDIDDTSGVTQELDWFYQSAQHFCELLARLIFARGQVSATGSPQQQQQRQQETQVDVLQVPDEQNEMWIGFVVASMPLLLQLVEYTSPHQQQASTSVEPSQVQIECMAPLLMSLGHLLELNDQIRHEAKQKGVMPMVARCLRAKREATRQVAERLLHLCSVTTSGKAASNSITDQPDPSPNEATATTAPVSGDLDPQLFFGMQVDGKDELSALLTVETLLDLMDPALDSASTFRVVRFTSRLLQVEATAKSFGAKTMDKLLALLAIVPQDERKAAFVAYLAKSIALIAAQSGEACDIAGSEGRNPVAFLVEFLRERLLPSAYDPVINGTDSINSEPHKEGAASLDLLEIRMFPLHWGDNAIVAQCFDTKQMTLEPMDALVWVTRSLQALANGLVKNNAASGVLPDIGESIARAAAESTASATTATPSAAAGSKNASASKRKDIRSTAGPSGEAIARSIVEKALDWLQLLDHSVHHSACCIELLKLLQVLMAIPGAKRYFLAQIEKQRSQQQTPDVMSVVLPTPSSASASASSTPLTSPRTVDPSQIQQQKVPPVQTEGLGASLVISTLASDSDHEFEPEPSGFGLLRWPLLPKMTRNTVHFALISPVMQVLELGECSFELVEAAVRVLTALTSEEPLASEPVGGAPGNAATTPANTSSKTAVDTPSLETQVLCDEDRFVNALVASGLLVTLISFLDKLRAFTTPPDSELWFDSFESCLERLVAKCITLGRIKHEMVQKLLSPSASTLDDLASSSGALTPHTPNGNQPPPKSMTPASPTTARRTTASAPVPSTPAPALNTAPLEVQDLWAKLLDVPRDVPRLNHFGYSALMMSTELGRVRFIKELLTSGVSTETCDQDGTSPLMLALLSGNSEAINMLFDAKANVDTMNRYEVTVWQCCLMSPAHSVDARYLDRLPLDDHLHQAPWEALQQRNALQAAAFFVPRCLDAGVDVNISDCDGSFPLHLLVSRAHLRKRIRGRTVGFLYHSQRAAPALTDMVEQLLACGAKVQVYNRVGQTPLQLALLYGHADIAQLLLRHGTNPNSIDAFGWNAFHYLCLGFCGPEETLTILNRMLQICQLHEVVEGHHLDLRKGKSVQAKVQLEMDLLLDEALQDILQPRALTRKFASIQQVLGQVSRAGFCPLHIACGAVVFDEQVALEDEMYRQFALNGPTTRVEIVRFLKKEAHVDLSVKSTGGLNALHLAAKTDQAGSNAALIEFLLAEKVDANAVYEVAPGGEPTSGQAPWEPRLLSEGSIVTYTSSSAESTSQCCVARRRANGTYDLLVHSQSELVLQVPRNALKLVQCDRKNGAEEIRPDDDRSQEQVLFNSQPFCVTPLHFALACSDESSQILLSSSQVKLQAEGADVPVLALACACRRDLVVISKLINEQANVRVQLGTNPASTALHYAVQHREYPVVQELLSHPQHVSVHVKRLGDGFTALHLACSPNHGALDAKIAWLLIESGASLVEPAEDGVTTALRLLVQARELSLLTRLVETKKLTGDMVLDKSVGDGVSLVDFAQQQHQTIVSADIEAPAEQQQQRQPDEVEKAAQVAALLLHLSHGETRTSGTQGHAPKQPLDDFLPTPCDEISHEEPVNVVFTIGDP